MKPTRYAIHRPPPAPGGTPIAQTGEVLWPQDPCLDAIHALIDPLLDGGDLEHVYVLGAGDRRASMFVDGDGGRKGLRRNEAATAIYRANIMRREPGSDPESHPFVVGTAIVFERLVWS